MARSAHFIVDPRLAALLGEGYRTTEAALKELVDNAWDADAENVWIRLPTTPVTSGAIVIRNDGCGMTTNEVEHEYLNIASDRRSRKGELTPVHKRMIKGRKGIARRRHAPHSPRWSVDRSWRGAARARSGKPAMAPIAWADIRLALPVIAVVGVAASAYAALGFLASCRSSCSS